MACTFAKVGRDRVVLVVRTTSPIGVVEDVEVVAISTCRCRQEYCQWHPRVGFPTPVPLQEERRFEDYSQEILRRQESISPNLMDQRYPTVLDSQGAILGMGFQGVLT